MFGVRRHGTICSGSLQDHIAFQIRSFGGNMDQDWFGLFWPALFWRLRGHWDTILSYRKDWIIITERRRGVSSLGKRFKVCVWQYDVCIYDQYALLLENGKCDITTMS